MDEQRIRRFTLFASLPDEQVTNLANTVGEWHSKAGATLMKQDEEALRLYAIEEGSVEVLKGDERIATLKAGEVVGDVGASSGGPRSATVRTLEESAGFLLTNSQIRSLKRASEDFERQLDQLVDDRRGGD